MKSLLLALIVPSLSISAYAQEQTPLYKEIAAMDKVLFDAFNRQDAEGVKAVFSTDLEFFHDMGGLQNYEQNHEATRKLFARNLQLKRELLRAEGLEVGPSRVRHFADVRAQPGGAGVRRRQPR